MHLPRHDESGSMEDICIYVANHRDAEALPEKPYKLLRVGSDNVGDVRHMADVAYDSAGASISYKNFAYCELTGLYWIWKNVSHGVTGMMHYRRYLANPGEGRPLGEGEIRQALKEHDFLVPRPAVLGCSLAEQYLYCHVSYDLIALAQVMEGQADKYRLAFSGVMTGNMIIPCNIMIARKPLIDSYCEWLFSVLGQCEQYVDLYSGRDSYQQRVFGFMAERLLLVWLVANDVDCGFYDVLALDTAEILHGAPIGGYNLNLSSALDGLNESQLFDEEFYCKRYDDVAQAYAPEQSIRHYLDYGIKEGRIPSAAYAMDDYANLRPKLRAKMGELSPELFDRLMREAKRKKKPVLSKNLVLGITRDGLIDYAPVYDWEYYTNRYDDVPDDYFQTELALRHFIDVGIPEGRQGTKGFSLDVYRRKHPELAERFGSDNRRYYLHYLRGEGRKRHPVDWNYAE